MTSLRERIRASPRHTGVEFEAHLEGTEALLRAWGRRRAAAGRTLPHGLRNPEGRAAIASAASRELVVEIGEEAEHLVQLWAGVERRSIVTAARSARRTAPVDSIELSLAAGGTTTVSAQVHLDLAYLHAANTLEQATRTGTWRAIAGRVSADAAAW